jgi:lipopolysaccharide transport system ATP-binding protein
MIAPSRVISVRGIGKRFTMGRREQATAREALEDLLRRPVPNGKTADLWALSDVSVDINEGEVVGIMGRNGAGKSVLLKILARVTRPTTGSATVIGRLAPLLEVGTGFHPELSGRENIYLNGAILGMRRSEVQQRVDEIVDFSEAQEFLDEPIKHYSSGMRMRLAFAVAVHLDRDVFLLDEVLAVGDADFQEKCLNQIARLAHEGRTILFVSHGTGVVERLCTRAILLERGRVIADADPVGVAAQYDALRRERIPDAAGRA